MSATSPDIKKATKNLFLKLFNLCTCMPNSKHTYFGLKCEFHMVKVHFVFRVHTSSKVKEAKNKISKFSNFNNLLRPV